MTFIGVSAGHKFRGGIELGIAYKGIANICFSEKII
jgi:hypothetical protein